MLLLPGSLPPSADEKRPWFRSVVDESSATATAKTWPTMIWSETTGSERVIANASEMGMGRGLHPILA